MLDCEKDAKVALEFLNRNASCFFKNGYNYVYTATNEDLKNYFYIFPIERSNVLTISSSGDHILEALKYYPKSITAFDKNKFTLYFSKLKIESIKILTVDEFNKYFYGNESEFFNIHTYKKIREVLDHDTKYFWDKLYLKGNILENLYFFFLRGSIHLENENIVRNKEEYKLIQDNSNIDIKYVYSEFFNITKKLSSTTKYSSVFLSNIYDWMGNTKENLNKYIDYIYCDLSPHLTSNGLVALYTSVSGSRQKKLEKFSDTILDFNESTKVYIYERKKHI